MLEMRNIYNEPYTQNKLPVVKATTWSNLYRQNRDPCKIFNLIEKHTLASQFLLHFLMTVCRPIYYINDTISYNNILFVLGECPGGIVRG